MEISNDIEHITLSFSNLVNTGAVNMNAKNSYFEINGIDMKTILQKFVGKYKSCNLELCFFIQGGFNNYTTNTLFGHDKTIYLEIDGLNWIYPNPPHLKNTKGKIFGTYTFSNGFGPNSVSVIENQIIFRNYTFQQEAFSIENIEFVNLSFSLKTIANGILANPSNAFSNFTIYFNIYPILESAVDTTSISEFNKETLIKV
jgi:hypothetical protein